MAGRRSAAAACAGPHVAPAPTAERAPRSSRGRRARATFAPHGRAPARCVRLGWPLAGRPGRPSADRPGTESLRTVESRRGGCGAGGPRDRAAHERPADRGRHGDGGEAACRHGGLDPGRRDPGERRGRRSQREDDQADDPDPRSSPRPGHAARARVASARGPPHPPRPRRRPRRSPVRAPARPRPAPRTSARWPSEARGRRPTGRWRRSPRPRSRRSARPPAPPPRPPHSRAPAITPSKSAGVAPIAVAARTRSGASARHAWIARPRPSAAASTTRAARLAETASMSAFDSGVCRNVQCSAPTVVWPAASHPALAASARLTGALRRVPARRGA